MILALIMFLTAPTASVPTMQRVEGNVHEKVRADLERNWHDYEYVETRRVPGARLENELVVLRWRLAKPPESHRALTEEQRSAKESVSVSLTDHVDSAGAKRSFDAMRRESSPDGEIPGLGDAAVFGSRGKFEESLTWIHFRIDKYYVRILAPDGPTGLRFAKSTAEALRDVQKAKAD